MVLQSITWYMVCICIHMIVYLQGHFIIANPFYGHVFGRGLGVWLEGVCIMWVCVQTWHDSQEDSLSCYSRSHAYVLVSAWWRFC